MLSDSQDTPTAFSELTVDLAVTLTVAGNLGLPEFAVSLRCPIALGTPVPEASIDKDRQPLLPEGEIRLSRKFQMASPSGDSLLAEELHQHPLRFLVPLPSNQGHHLGPLFLGKNVRHSMSFSKKPKICLWELPLDGPIQHASGIEVLDQEGHDLVCDHIGVDDSLQCLRRHINLNSHAPARLALIGLPLAFLLAPTQSLVSSVRASSSLLPDSFSRTQTSGHPLLRNSSA